MNRPQRRFAILAEGKFSPLESKTANQAIRYLPEEVSCVIDSSQAGKTAHDILGFGGGIPVVAGLEESWFYHPDTLLIGIAPTGGLLPETWRPVIAEAIRKKLTVISGLHTLLAEDEEFSALAKAERVRIIDLRAVPSEYRTVAKGNWRSRKAKTILTVGTDCNVGKMTASLELHREFERRGLRSDFLATGQTGMLLSGRGFAVDSVISDYVAGAVEYEIDKREQEGTAFIHVEGQGSLTHQGYSAVTLGLMHGVMPDAMVMVHHPIRLRDDYGFPIDDVGPLITLHEAMVRCFKQTKVTGIAVNTAMMTSSQAETVMRTLEEQYGLPAANVLSRDVTKLADSVLSYLEGGSV